MQFIKLEYLILNFETLYEYFKVDEITNDLIEQYLEEGPTYNFYLPLKKEKDENEYIKYLKDISIFNEGEIIGRMNIANGYVINDFSSFTYNNEDKKNLIRDFLKIEHNSKKTDFIGHIALRELFIESEFLICSIKKDDFLYEQKLTENGYIKKFEVIDASLEEVIQNINDQAMVTNVLSYKLSN